VLSDSSTSTVPAGLVARRPILDAEGVVRGYELRLRDAATLSGGRLADLIAATSWSTPAWVPVTRELLMADGPLPLPPGSVVLQIAADVRLDGQLLMRLRTLRADGHRVALADVLRRREPVTLGAVADYVTVDLAAQGSAGVRALVRRVAHGGPQVVVRNVDTPRQRDECVGLGATLLQGFYFERPRPAANADLEAAAAGVVAVSIDRLHTLLALHDRPGFDDIEAVVASDPGLTVRLLRFANSASISAGRRLGSIREAMVVLGAERVRQFLLVVLVSELGAQRPALVAAALLRARLCETLMREQPEGNPDTAFTAGLLSVVDALLDRPMGEVLRALPVSDELYWALLGHGGPLGAALAMAIRIERHGTGDVATRFERFGEVVGWTDRTLAGLVA
jgi:EAL and modified HD-GYP domain-containing signal transduction protein